MYYQIDVIFPFQETVFSCDLEPFFCCCSILVQLKVSLDHRRLFCGLLWQGVIDGLFGWGLTPGSLIACILIDYIIAFTVLGLAGLFREKGLSGWIIGTVLAIVLRLFMHFLSGVVIWKSFGELWGGFATENTVLYSLLYNGAYMVPEIIFTVIGAVVLFKAPQTRKYILSEK